MKLHERFSTLSPIYSGGLTNHLPMMITALRLLDVDPDVIEQIAEEYVESKSIVDLSNSGIENDPFSDEYIRLTNYYLQEMKHQGMEKVLHKMLSTNKYSLQSGLFHGLIRVAYAYLENDELLVAQGLAYFDIIKEEMKLEGSLSTDIHGDFEKLAIVRRKEVEMVDSWPGAKIQAVIDNETIRTGLFYPKDMLKYKDVALELFVDQYIKTKDFYILHVITGYHALHILSQFFDDQEETFHNFFMQSLVVLLINSHDSYKEETSEEYGFVALAKRVPELKDAHDIKLFYSLAYFFERYDLDQIKQAISLIF